MAFSVRNEKKQVIALGNCEGDGLNDILLSLVLGSIFFEVRILGALSCEIGR
jgi:hypothetical protein